MSDADAQRQYTEWCRHLLWPDFWSEKDDLLSDWAVEPLIPAGRQVAIWARAKVGKSLLALDVSAASATGASVLGQPCRDPIEVVYVDLEMTASDLRDRMEALGYGPKSDLERLRYYQAVDLPPLDSALGGDVMAAICDKWQARLLVVDTMARAVNGEENNSDTYRNFQQHTGGKLRALGVAVVLLDHGGKDARQGQRGSSAKEDGVDVVFRLAQVGEFLVLHRTHSRVPWVPAEVNIRREDEPLLRHVLAPVAYPDGTADLADLLDDLAVPLTCSIRDTMATLRDASQGRRQDVVAAALKYRRRPR